MESRPPATWDFRRPNPVTWVNDLSAVPPSRSINDVRGRIFDLGRRLDSLTQPPVDEEEEYDFEDEEGVPQASDDMPPPPVPSRPPHGVRRSAEHDFLIVNETPVCSSSDYLYELN